MIPARTQSEELAIYEEQQSLPTLLSRLSKETTQLIVQQIALARTELDAKLNEAKQGAIALATSSVVSICGLLMLLFAAAYGIGEVLPTWAGFLIVGGTILAIGAGLAAAGKQKLAPERLKPTETQAMLQKDKEFIKEQL